ncbi:MAG: 6-phosphogluconolactonase [Candidatus Acidiferrum sp.]
MTERTATNGRGREVRILPSAAAIAQCAAEKFVEAGRSAVAERGSFAVALAGGSTPKALYELLVGEGALRGQIPWDKTYFFFGDERHVGPNDADSNFRMASESLLSHAPIQPNQVTRIKGELGDTEQAARDYEDALRSHFGLKAGELPRFDLVLLGMGNEGHTLSLFPGTKALHPGGRLAVRNWIGKLYAERITLTAPAANNARLVIFMVTGADKALALKGVLEGPHEPEQLPSQLIQPANGKLIWLVDQAAGGMLSAAIRE